MALNSQLQTYQIWQAMIRCTFCVFLILLLLYKNDLIVFKKSDGI